MEFVDTDGLSEVAAMADVVWHEYFPCILTDGQIDYMVERFQSERAMREQVSEKGYRYAFIMDGDVRVGYTGISVSDRKLFISKLYLLKENRGKGYGTAALQMLFDLAREEGLRSAYLTVNKYNDRAIRTYRANGFETIQSIVTDIGEGFVMDDFVMEKIL